MDQVSRPVQILLLVALVFGALWLVVLRPKANSGGAPSTPAPAAAPPAARPPAKSAIPGGMGRAVDSARSGAARANADNTGRSAGVDAAATGTPAPTSAPARSGRAPASPARPTGQPLGGAVPHSDNAVVQSGFVALSFVGVALAGEPAGGREAAARSARRPTAPARRPAAPARVTSPDRVTSALAARKTVVLLFYGRGSDDQAMRREMAKVERRGSRVMVLSAPVDTVSRFSVITAGVRVLQSPSVVVVGPTRKARVLPGFTDSTEIDQAVESALRS